MLGRQVVSLANLLCVIVKTSVIGASQVHEQNVCDLFRVQVDNRESN